MTRREDTARSLISALRRLDTQLDIQSGRVGSIQRRLDDQETRLARLALQIDASSARIDALLA